MITFPPVFSLETTKGKTMKTAINKLLIWLNTPREIDLPWFGENTDAQLYDDFNRQKTKLAEREAMILAKLKSYVFNTAVLEEGYFISEQQAELRARQLLNEAKADGRINGLNELVNSR